VYTYAISRPYALESALTYYRAAVAYPMSDRMFKTKSKVPVLHIWVCVCVRVCVCVCVCACVYASSQLFTSHLRARGTFA